MAGVVVGATQTPLSVPNYTRLGRVNAMRAIRAGSDNASYLVIKPPDWAQKWFVWDFLRALPNVGPKTLVRVGHAAVADGINLGCSLGQLSFPERVWLERQVEAIIESPRGHPVIAARPQG